MTGDYRYFIKVHNGFPEHRKTAELSDRAFRRLVEAWCFCSRNLNDGKLTNTQVSQLFSPKVRDELVLVGYLEQRELDWYMHDYLAHQMSAADVADLRRKRAAAGSRGGKAKAEHLASASGLLKQNGSKPVADIDVDVDEEQNKDTEGHLSNANGSDHTAEDEPRSKPVPPNINRLAKRYTDIVKLSDRGKVCAVVLNAVGAGYSESQIGTALDRLATAEMAVTADTLRIEITGRVANGRASPKPSTTDQRVTAGLDLARRLAAQEAAEESQRLEIEA